MTSLSLLSVSGQDTQQEEGSPHLVFPQQSQLGAWGNRHCLIHSSGQRCQLPPCSLWMMQWFREVPLLTHLHFCAACGSHRTAASMQRWASLPDTADDGQRAGMAHSCLQSSRCALLVLRFWAWNSRAITFLSLPPLRQLTSDAYCLKFSLMWKQRHGAGNDLFIVTVIMSTSLNLGTLTNFCFQPSVECLLRVRHCARCWKAHFYWGRQEHKWWWALC